jgi:hypothetical protein
LVCFHFCHLNPLSSILFSLLSEQSNPDGALPLHYASVIDASQVAKRANMVGIVTLAKTCALTFSSALIP